MRYVSLFSGIGGLDLGLDRAGWTCVAQCESDEFRRSILRKHWPEVPRHDDARTFLRWWSRQGIGRVDAVVGGFPCQPFSVAATGYRGGRRTGTADRRWGWPWMRAVIEGLRPDWVLFENVPGLLSDPTDPFGEILADLAALRFDAEWGVVSACALGAPHPRERLFLVAHADRLGLTETGTAGCSTEEPGPEYSSWWATESGVGRVADGSAGWVDRIAALGNSVVPGVAELVGRRVMSRVEETNAVQDEWSAYLAYLRSAGFLPFAEHKACHKTYGVNGSAGYYCRDHRVKVMPAP